MRISTLVASMKGTESVHCECKEKGINHQSHLLFVTVPLSRSESINPPSTYQHPAVQATTPPSQSSPPSSRPSTHLCLPRPSRPTPPRPPASAVPPSTACTRTWTSIRAQAPYDGDDALLREFRSLVGWRRRRRRWVRRLFWWVWRRWGGARRCRCWRRGGRRGCRSDEAVGKVSLVYEDTRNRYSHKMILRRTRFQLVEMFRRVFVYVPGLRVVLLREAEDSNVNQLDMMP